MRPGFRAAMTWLHDWSGLVIGWLLFAITLAGSLSAFREEISAWARPEASCCDRDSVAATSHAVAWLSIHAAGAPSWYIRPADARATATYAFWPDARRGSVQTWLDARSGSPDRIRETLGGEFFYRLHFELQLPYPWGRILSGSAAMVMLLAMLSGIVAHRRFFADFFTFRPGKGQRSWLDAHNLLAVTALPFHLLITFTGALTLSVLLMPWGTRAAFGDPASAYKALEPNAIDRPATGRPAPLAPFGPMLRIAQARFRGGLFDIAVAHPGDAAAVVTVARAEDARIGIEAAHIRFDGVTGRILSADDEVRPGVATYNIFYGLHTARFAAVPLRWLYLICGLMLTATIGSGLMLWTRKRAEKRQQDRPERGIMLVDRLNLGFVGGAPIAFAAFFLANRLLPIGLAARATMETRAFFWTWGALLLFAALRARPRAWRELTWLAAAALAAIAIADVATGAFRPSGLAVDLTALALAGCYAAAALIQQRAAARLRA